MLITAYVGGRPFVAGDPTGLFFSIGELLGANSWQAELQQSYAGEMRDIHTGFKDGLTAMLAGYMLNQYMGADWASDWLQPDYVIESQLEISGDADFDFDFAGTLPKDARFPSWLRNQYKGTGQKLHHVATPYGEVGKQLGTLFAMGKMKLGDVANALPLLHHKGPHSKQYNAQVLDRFSKAVNGLTKKDNLNPDRVRGTIEMTLQHIKDDIASGRLRL